MEMIFYGISVEHISGDMIHLNIHSNSISDNGGTGVHVIFSDVIFGPIFLGQSNFLTHFSTSFIEDNTILRNGNHGIDFAHDTYNFWFWWVVVVSDNGLEDEIDFFSPHIVFTRNHIHDSNNSGINITSSYTDDVPDEFFLGNDVELNVGLLDDMYTFYHITKNFVLYSGNDGISLTDSDSWLIANNLVAYTEGCSGNGIKLFDSLCLTMNNTIYDNENNGILFVPGPATSLGQGIVSAPGYYINNIIVGNGGYGLSFDFAATLGVNGDIVSDIHSNNVWGNDAGNYSPPFFDFTGMYGNISRDPLFASPDDPRLTVGSPCVDAGWDEALYVVRDDIEDVLRPQARHIDMGCYELIWNNFSPETFHPLVITQLANANATWTCLMSNLPDDPELMEEIESMLEEVQTHMGNATSISNYIQANGELRQALSIMAEIDAMCECGCAG